MARLIECQWDVSARGNRDSAKDPLSSMVIEARGKRIVEAAEGVGPVDAMYNGLVKGLTACGFEAWRISVFDYSVVFLNGTTGNGTKGAIAVTISMGRKRKKPVKITKASPNILEASLQCLVEGFEILLTVS